MKRANFAYQLATLRNKHRKPLHDLVELVLSDTTRCMEKPSLARKALMLRALIRGTYAIAAATEKKVMISLQQLDQCGLDFESILKQTPNYLQAYLFRAEIYFNALAQDPDGFLRLGGRTNVIGLLHMIYKDLLRVLAPSDNAQAFLLRAQVELLELFLNRENTTKEEAENLAKMCQEDAKRGESFNPALSRYLVLAGQVFECTNTPPVDSQQRYRTLYQNLKKHLENHPELVSDQSNFLLREVESVLQTDQD